MDDDGTGAGGYAGATPASSRSRRSSWEWDERVVTPTSEKPAPQEAISDMIATLVVAAVRSTSSVPAVSVKQVRKKIRAELAMRLGAIAGERARARVRRSPGSPSSLLLAHSGAKPLPDLVHTRAARA